jgi:hypothetical protein
MVVWTAAKCNPARYISLEKTRRHFSWPSRVYTTPLDQSSYNFIHTLYFYNERSTMMKSSPLPFLAVLLLAAATASAAGGAHDFRCM